MLQTFVREATWIELRDRFVLITLHCRLRWVI